MYFFEWKHECRVIYILECKHVRERIVRSFPSNFVFAAIMSHNSAKSSAEDATRLADPKVFMKAMMSEVRHVIKLELEQV